MVTQSGSVSLTATSGTLANGGLIQAGTGAALQAGTAISNTGSVLTQGGDATLQAGTDLTNGGLVIAQTGGASLTATSGTLSNSGLVQAETSATLQAASGIANAGSIVALTGNASLTTASGTLSSAGVISAAASGAVVTLTASGGPIVQPVATGRIIAGGSVAMTASGGITLNGLVQDDTGVTLNSGGAISQNGILIADLLTGSAAGNVDLLGTTPTANQVATLGNFTAGGGRFALNDGTNLQLNGVVSALTISINDGTNTISLGNGGFVTGGTVRPPTAVPSAQLPPNGLTTQGAYLIAGSVIQTGDRFTVTNQPGTRESVLSITLSPNSPTDTLQFNTGGGLQAPGTWLILNIANGRASGLINVAALDFLFSPPPGQAALSGLVNNLAGNAAAAASFISPQSNANFRINGCPIHSVNCVLLATQGLPTASPVNDILLGLPPTQDPEDLVLPVVSDERYEVLGCEDPNGAAGVHT